MNSSAHFRLKALCLAVTSACAALQVEANPVNPTVVHGSATFSNSGNTLTVTNTPNAIINWQQFGINANETVRFVQQSAASAVLNRVTGADPSHILGTLQSNGRVFLINPAGIMFGQGAVVDVAGLVAATLNITDSDFLNGRLQFNADRAHPGSVVNAGQITTPNGGFVYLIAPQVENSGVITTPSGEAILAAGNSVELVDSADPALRVKVSAQSQDVNLSQMMTQSGGNIFNVLNSGRVSANTAVVGSNGKIVFKSAGQSIVSGTVEATSSAGTGGTVHVLGEQVGLVDQASIDVSGKTGGGTILVGGDYQGKNPDVPNATVTFVGGATQLKADATENGDGGKVIVWADDTARVYGTLSARGGQSGGDGGFIETSGHRYIDVARAADVGAAFGLGGTWLIDPTDITIVHAAGANEVNMSGGPNFSAAAALATSQISDFTLNSAINGGVAVTLSTASAGPSAGDIIFDGSSNGAITISKNTNTFSTNLTLNADRNIVFDGATTFETTAGAGAQSLNVVMNPGAAGNIVNNAGSSVTLNGQGVAPGMLIVQVSGNHSWTNNGLVSLQGRSQIKLHAGSNPSTFSNNGTLNLNNTSNWSFFSSAAQDGMIVNNGVFNVSQNVSFEAKYDQTSSGTLNIGANKSLSLQNAQTIEGDAFIDSGATLWVSEWHGTDAHFLDTQFSGTGTLKVGGVGAAKARFENVYAPSNLLNIANNGEMKVENGTTKFKTVTFSGSGSLTNITDGTLASVTDLSIPNGVTYSGIVGYESLANLTLPSGVTLTGLNNDFYLDAGNNLLIDGIISHAGGAGIHGYLSAGNDILFSGSSSVVNGGAGPMALTMTADHDIALNATSLKGGLYAYAAHDVITSGAIGSPEVELVAGNKVSVGAGISAVANAFHPDASIWIAADNVDINAGLSATSAAPAGGAEVEIYADNLATINANISASSTNAEGDIDIFGINGLNVTNASLFTSGGTRSHALLVSQNMTLDNTTVSGQFIGVNFEPLYMVTNPSDFFSFISTANVTVNNSTLGGAGTQHLGFAGRDVDILSSTLRGDKVSGIVQNDLTLDISGPSTTLIRATDEMRLMVGRKISLNSNLYDARINVTSPTGKLYFNFPLIASNGWEVDGIANALTSSLSSGTGIFVGGAPAIEKTNFFVTYGGINLPLRDILRRSRLDDDLEEFEMADAPDTEDFFTEPVEGEETPAPGQPKRSRKIRECS